MTGVRSGLMGPKESGRRVKGEESGLRLGPDDGDGPPRITGDISF